MLSGERPTKTRSVSSAARTIRAEQRKRSSWKPGGVSAGAAPRRRGRPGFPVFQRNGTPRRRMRRAPPGTTAERRAPVTAGSASFARQPFLHGSGGTPARDQVERFFRRGDDVQERAVLRSQEARRDHAVDGGDE